ncbi:MAG: hypothetical protein KIT06_00140 [Cryobacterium sp.]|nr:hypothetical protein [Cryobacterium sp.]
MFGGAVPDAMLAMIKLLSTLHDDNGGVCELRASLPLRGRP